MSCAIVEGCFLCTLLWHGLFCLHCYRIQVLICLLSSVVVQVTESSTNWRTSVTAVSAPRIVCWLTQHCSTDLGLTLVVVTGCLHMQKNKLFTLLLDQCTYGRNGLGETDWQHVYVEYCVQSVLQEPAVVVNVELHAQQIQYVYYSCMCYAVTCFKASKEHCI